jgi:2-polyprenyl-3-methyl-5-hydroxy-6-metoxy-1,4-benzoquinol methylase
MEGRGVPEVMRMLISQKLRELPCPACGLITEHQDLYRKNGCDILRCAACGLGRAEAEEFDPTAYYTENYFIGGHADGYANYLMTDPVLRREFARTVGFIRRYRSAGKLLELGCAYGFFLQEAKHYFEVAGIELAEDAAAYCRRNGLRVVQGVADDASMSLLGQMDVIVLLDVIEHLPEPYEVLSLCARHLRPGGILLLTTGDFGSATAWLMGPGWRLMTPPQHLWFFTAESINRLASRLGLRVERMEHPWKIVPFSLMLFQLGRMLRSKHGAAPHASKLGIPVNLFDAMRVVLRRAASS